MHGLGVMIVTDSGATIINLFPRARPIRAHRTAQYAATRGAGSGATPLHGLVSFT
jgi:hypothetical protein